MNEEVKKINDLLKRKNLPVGLKDQLEQKKEILSKDKTVKK